MHKSNTKRRLTIAMFIDWVAEYHMKLVSGAMDAARENDVNLIVVEGGCIESFREYEFERNMLYQMASPDEIDGVILLSASVGHFCDDKTMQAFVDGLKPMPVVCIAQEFGGAGFIGIDNSTGLIELIDHLVDCHQYRRFAMITGPQENQDTGFRKKTVKDALERYGIQLDEHMIVGGDYSQASGEKAMRMLFERGECDFDVIIAANDEMAFGAMEELKTRGVRVPEDVAVVGFDNLEVSAFSTPPLTTINQSLYEQGRRALELVVEMKKKVAEPGRIFQPTKLVIRESCGCYYQEDHRKPAVGKADGGPKADLAVTAGEIVTRIAQKWGPLTTGRDDFDLEVIVEKLLVSLRSHILDPQNAEFIKTCHELFQQTAFIENEDFVWHTIISEIRQYVVPNFSNEALIRAEDVLHQGRVMISEKITERQRAVYHESLQSNIILNGLNAVVYRKYDLTELIEALVKKLPQMGIATFFLDRFVTQGMILGDRKLLLAYNQKGHLDIDEQPVYAKKLVPDVCFSDGQPHALLVTLLQLSSSQFGLLGTELGLHNFSIYGALRRIICSTLNGIISDQEKQMISEQEHLKSLAQMKRMMEEFVRTILLTVEMRDPYTAGHQSKVADIADAIAVKMNYPPEIVEGVRMAGIVHDLGKICVPAEILNKPGRLTPVEFALIKEHPKVAYDILKNLKFPWPLAEIILQHHERLDGSGYPNGLKEEEILIEAKILAVADVIEAMASHRPYRPALGMDVAIKEIEKNRGILYDPAVVDACKDLFQ